MLIPPEIEPTILRRSKRRVNAHVDPSNCLGSTSGRGLTSVMRAGRGVQPYLAAVAFGALLATANCPV